MLCLAQQLRGAAWRRGDAAGRGEACFPKTMCSGAAQKHGDTETRGGDSPLLLFQETFKHLFVLRDRHKLCQQPFRLV